MRLVVRSQTNHIYPVVYKGLPLFVHPLFAIKMKLFLYSKCVFVFANQQHLKLTIICLFEDLKNLTMHFNLLINIYINVSAPYQYDMKCRR